MTHALKVVSKCNYDAITIAKFIQGGKEICGTGRLSEDLEY